MARKIIGVIIMVVLFIIGCFAGTMFYKQYADAKSSATTFEELQEQIKNTDELLNSEDEQSTTEDSENTPAETEPTVFDKYRPLQEQNSDMVGWIFIEGTEINYPVMQSPGDPDYYLLHNFDKEFSYRGCLYAQADCDVFTPSDNIVIYGHRMSDGSMFARLDRYMKEQYYRDNPYIFFDTLTELHTYKIVSVFLTTASVGKGFSYHTFVNANSEEQFNKFVKSVKSMALYDTGVDASYGDKLITLSTCEYSQTNGRLVIVAKRIS